MIEYDRMAVWKWIDFQCICHCGMWSGAKRKHYRYHKTGVRKFPALALVCQSSNIHFYLVVSFSAT